MTTIEAGARGFDALGDPAPPDVMARDGWRFRTFYITPTRNAAPSGKINLANVADGRGRIADYHAAGIAVLLNFEQEAEGWQGGAVEGRADGATARQIAEALGYPTDMPILVSWDTGITAETMPTAEAYGWGFASTCAPYPIGVYGGTPIIQRLEVISRLGWKAIASSWSPPQVRATVHWRQRRPSPTEIAEMPYVRGTDGRWRLDVNDVWLDFNAWLPGDDITKPDIIDQSEEDAMQLNYNGMILAVEAHAIRRVIHGGVVDLGPTPQPVNREVLAALIGQLHVVGDSPFAGGGDLELYRDAELDGIWSSRPRFDTSAGAVHLNGGAVTFPPVVGTITFG